MKLGMLVLLVGLLVTVSCTNPAPAPLTIATSSLPPFVVGKSYSANVVAAGGIPPYRFSLLSGSLPKGLVLNPDGSITGTVVDQTPTTFSFNAQVEDSAPKDAPK